MCTCLHCLIKISIPLKKYINCLHVWILFQSASSQPCFRQQEQKIPTEGNYKLPVALPITYWPQNVSDEHSWTSQVLIHDCRKHTRGHQDTTSVSCSSGSDQSHFAPAADKTKHTAIITWYHGKPAQWFMLRKKLLHCKPSWPSSWTHGPSPN